MTPHPCAVEIVAAASYDAFTGFEGEPLWDKADESVKEMERKFAIRWLSALIAAGYDQLTKEPRK